MENPMKNGNVGLVVENLRQLFQKDCVLREL